MIEAAPPQAVEVGARALGVQRGEHEVQHLLQALGVGLAEHGEAHVRAASQGLT